MHALVGVMWAAALYRLDPSDLWWLLPVVGALALSLPMSVYSSRVPLGRALRRDNLFLIPEEVAPPEELRIMRAHVNHAGEPPRFVDAVVDPLMNVIACAASPSHTRVSPRVQSVRYRAIAAAVEGGPHALTRQRKLFFLADPVALSRPHVQVSTSPAAHRGWLTGRHPDPARHHAVLRAAS